MRKVLLTYGYGLKNSGDMAITLGAIELLKKKYQDITILSRFDASHPEYEISKQFILKKFPEIKILPSPFKLDRNASIIKKIKNHINGGLQINGIIKNNNLEKIVKQSDLVVFNGGNLFRCNSFSDFARLLALLYPLRKAKQNSIPYIVFPQSAAKINWIGKKILKNTLRSAERVFTREDHSFHYLRKRLHLNNLEKAIDLAFFIDPENNKINNKVKENDELKTIAITLRGHTIGDLKEFNKERKEGIINLIENTLKDIESKYDVEFIVFIQTKKDKKISYEIFNKLKTKYKIKIIEEYNPLALISHYKKCNLLLGMRLHSIILALNSGTPALGLFDKSWGLKNPGLMVKFNLPYNFLNENYSYVSLSLSGNAIKLIENESSKRDQILNLIKSEEVKFDSILNT
ncbi:MAG: polysaccharide pyruvyl transferase family protein [Candidatus Woesearchaeota archaeon]